MLMKKPIFSKSNEEKLLALQTELCISDFKHFHWLARYRLSAHIPALPNMVNKRIIKYKRKCNKNFPSKPAIV